MSSDIGLPRRLLNEIHESAGDLKAHISRQKRIYKQKRAINNFLSKYRHTNRRASYAAGPDPNYRTEPRRDVYFHQRCQFLEAFRGSHDNGPVFKSCLSPQRLTGKERQRRIEEQINRKADLDYFPNAPPWNMTVHKDDKLRGRGANPRTGLITPTVTSSSSSGMVDQGSTSDAVSESTSDIMSESTSDSTPETTPENIDSLENSILKYQHDGCFETLNTFTRRAQPTTKAFTTSSLQQSHQIRRKPVGSGDNSCMSSTQQLHYMQHPGVTRLYDRSVRFRDKDASARSSEGSHLAAKSFKSDTLTGWTDIGTRKRFMEGIQPRDNSDRVLKLTQCQKARESRKDRIEIGDRTALPSGNLVHIHWDKLVESYKPQWLQDSFHVMIYALLRMLRHIVGTLSRNINNHHGLVRKNSASDLFLTVVYTVVLYFVARFCTQCLEYSLVIVKLLSKVVDCMLSPSYC